MAAVPFIARIFKPGDPDGHDVSDYERAALESRAPQSPLGAVEEEAPVDPEVLREQILAEARAEAERLVQEAYAEGKRRGEEAGAQAFRESVAEAAEALKGAAAAMESAREAFLESLAPEFGNLIRNITARVLDREVRTDPELIQRTARRALAALTDREQVKLRVNPADAAALREQQVTLLEEFDGVKHIEVLADETVGPGGCLAESELMASDARLDSLLETVLAALDE